MIKIDGDYSDLGERVYSYHIDTKEPVISPIIAESVRVCEARIREAFADHIRLGAPFPHRIVLDLHINEETNGN